MLALTVVVLWFGLVAAYLVRQWWSSELAQTREGVPASAPVALAAAEGFAPTPWGREIAGVAWARAVADCPKDVREPLMTGRWGGAAA